MENFNNEVYVPLIDDLIYESFYIENRTIRGKFATIRQYSEVVIRKIFDIPETEKVMLGMQSITERIKQINNPLLTSSVETIRSHGNDNTHTQKISKPTESDLHEVVDSLMKLYAYLFIQYFEKYRFGTNEIIMAIFSHLPPIIRYITLKYLYENDKSNPAIINKLLLATIKAKDKVTVEKWIEDEKNNLINVGYLSEGELELIKSIPILDNEIPKNMYDFCKNKIISVSQILDNNGVLYKTFEEALPYYEQLNHIYNNIPEYNEFYSITDFCYIGRKKVMVNKDIRKYHSISIKNISKK